MQKRTHQNDLVFYRERMGFSQHHVAKLLGTKDTSLVSRLELGRRLPTFKTALKLGALYRVPADFLFTQLYTAIRAELRKREQRLLLPKQGLLNLRKGDS